MILDKYSLNSSVVHISSDNNYNNKKFNVRALKHHYFAKHFMSINSFYHWNNFSSYYIKKNEFEQF